MKKSLYIFILVLISTKFFGLHPFGDIFTALGGIPWFLKVFIWMSYGALIYKSKAHHDLFVKKNILPVIWIFVGIFFSFIPAYVYSGQSPLVSFSTYRYQYFWVVLFLIIYIKPLPNDIIKSLSWFSVLFVVAALAKHYLVSDWFYISEAEDDKQSRYIDDILYPEGLSLLLIPFYYYCSKIRQSSTIRDLIIILFFFFSFFILHNRSTLLIAVLIVAFSILTKKSKFRIPFILLSLGIGFLIVYFTKDVWIDIYEETMSQIDNNDYNRIVAINYFFSEGNPNWVTSIFGNGFLSAHVNSRYYDLAEMGIFNSDVGFVGYWNYYGVIPIIVFITYIFRSFFSKRCPFYVKAIGFHMLCCSLTISYFAKAEGILWFSFFYYFYVYFTSNKVLQVVHP